MYIRIYISIENRYFCKVFGLIVLPTNSIYFPIIELLEKCPFTLDTWTTDEMSCAALPPAERAQKCFVGRLKCLKHS